MPQTLLAPLLENALSWQRRLDRLRARTELQVLDSTHVLAQGRRYTNFASNNYLGLTHHPLLGQALAEAAAGCTGSGASGLISGYTQLHAAAEAALASWKGTQAAVLMPSGYQAAHAVVQTLAAVGRINGRPARFLIDKLCHASLIDALAAVPRAFRVFPHNHLGKLKRLLSQTRSDELPVVLTESVFSMEGDMADLAGLAQLKQTYPFVLVLDEAHASGVYGPGGAGYAAHCGLQSIVDIAIVTLSKALGLVGGAVCACAAFCQSLLNWGRAYIYSTSVPPALAAAVPVAISILRQEPHRQERLRALACHVRCSLAEAGLIPCAGDCPIIPIVLGSERRTLAATELLREKGMLVAAVRPPTVGPGRSRLRISLSCDHTDQEVQELLEALRCLPERL